VSERRPVLVVQHEDECPPAWFGQWLGSTGVELDVRRPYAGEPLPTGLGDHAGLLVLGGAMGADDDADYSWLAPTRTLLAEACDTGVPTLGICLGHQLLAVAAGGRVERLSTGRQCGLLPVGWTDQAGGDELLGPLVRAGGYDQPLAVHWNVDVVTVLPPGAVALAHTPSGALQAMRVTPCAWGIQAHPEAGLDVVTAWMQHDPPAASAPEHQLWCDLAAGEPTVRAAWEPLATGFARLVLARRAATPLAATR